MEIVYTQDGEKLLIKGKNDCTFDGKTALLKLSQEETFKFKDTCDAEVQARVLTEDGSVFGTDVVTIKVEESKSEEVLK